MNARLLLAPLLLLTACAGLDTRTDADRLLDRTNPGVRRADERCSMRQVSAAGPVVDCRSGSLVMHHAVYYLDEHGAIRRWYRY